MLVFVGSLIWGNPLNVAASEACEGSSLSSVILQGCKGHFCESDEIREKYIRVVEQSLDGDITPQKVRYAANRLTALKTFYRVDVDCRQTAEGSVELELLVFPRKMIRKLVVKGNLQIYAEELRKRIFLRPGLLLAVGQPEGDTEVRRQRQTLLNFYERSGFMNTQVRVEFRDVGPDQVDCLVFVEEGQRRRIEDANITVVRELTPDTVGDDRLSDEWQCPYFTERQLKKAAGLEDIEVHTERSERMIKTNLTEFLQKYGVIEPRVSADFDPSSGQLRLNVNYQFCHRIQFLVRYDLAPGDTGYRFREPELWRDVLSFGTSGTYDFEEAEYSRRLLESHLENEGLLFSDIRLDYREIDPRQEIEGARGTPVSSISTYLVTEGYITEIRAIEFDGMSHFKPDEIREQLETQKYDFFGEGGYLQVQKFFKELEDLRVKYQENGFLSARYVGFQPTEGAYLRTRTRKGDVDVFFFVSGDIGFTAKKPVDENVVYLKVEIEEGPRTKLKSLKVRGCEPYCRGMRRVMEWPDGSAYSRAILRRSLRSAQLHFEDRGFPNVKFTLDCQSLDEDGEGQKCDPEAVTGTSVSLVLSVSKGPQVQIGEVFTSGNFRTKDSVLVRDIPSRGDFLRRGDLRGSERKLRNLGVFNTVRVLPFGLDDRGAVGAVPVLVEVEESSSQFLDFALGFESLNRVDLSSAESGKMPPPVSSIVSNGVELEDRAKGYHGHPVPFDIPDLLLVFQTEYLNTNLFGNAQEFRIPVKYGVSTTDPLRVVAGAPTWIERRFLGTELVFRETVYGLYDKARNPFDLLEVGSQTEVSTALTDNLFLSARYNLSANSVRQLDTENPRFESPDLINKFSPTFGWQKLDALTHPTEGFGATVSSSYINSIELENGEASNHLKWLGSIKGFVNARGRIVLANFLKIGTAYSVEGNPLPDVERFRLGGAKGVRGFEDGEITQYNRNGTVKDADPATSEIERIDGGDSTLSGTTELRFPFMVDVGPLALWGATFFDWGGLADSFLEFHGKSFRTSAGLGIRLLLYGRVPIRLDYGIKIAPRCKKYTDDYGDCAERESPGELDFNLLYTF